MPVLQSPNILLITTDQQRADTLGCYGAGWMRTPNLDRVAAEGVRFERAYTTSPLCTPSRVSLFTGQYPSRHGAWNVGCNAEDDGAFISHTLAAAGYRTHHIGKAHWEANLATPEQSVEAIHGNTRFPGWQGPYFGFETVELSIGHNGYNLLTGHYADWVREQCGGKTDFEWSPRCCRAFGAGAVDWGLPLRWHASVWTADRALAFLDGHDRSRPFFLHLGFQDPHHPHAVPRDFYDRIDPAAVPLPEYRDGELHSRPGHYLAAREGYLENHAVRGKFPMAGQGEGFDYRGISEEDVRDARAYYFTLCQLIDREVGRVLSKLDACGLTENTLVIFSSDHGELLGDHGLWLKGCFAFDELLRVPLLFRWPGKLPAGKAVKDVISLADIAPTILAAAGLRRECGPPVRDGVDWLPCLTDSAPCPPRDHALIEHMDDPEKLRFRTMITSDHKFTLWRGAGLDYELTAPDDSILDDPDGRIADGMRDQLAALLPAEPRQLPRLAYS